MSENGSNHSHGASNPAFSTQSDYDRREQERRERRLQELSRIAATRNPSSALRAYYASELHGLLSTLILPSSRVLDVGCGLGDLLARLSPREAIGIDVSPELIEQGRERHPGLDLRVVDVERDPLPEGPFDVIILTDTIGLLGDIQNTLERLRPLLAANGRLIVTYYNFLWEPVLKLAEQLRLKTSWPDQNWLSMSDIGGILHLSGYEVVRQGTDLLLPLDVPLVSPLANRVLAKLPLTREFALVDFFVARALPVTYPKQLPGVSVICPCRNEKGNIREAIARTPVMGPHTELIFVDGNSSDGTVEEIEAAIRDYRGPLELKLVPQGDGKGKGDAVRKGFAAAKYQVLMILDSDLTVPPEDLPKFYNALVTGKGEFINGVRLVYPMEQQAMRFLNLLGNKFFSAALSWLLEQPIKDSLCGTKVLLASDYQKIADNRSFFGEFDPFGDFDLLFGAARLNMKIIDVPVRYRARTYGETKIHRFAHGWLLLKMTAFGFRKFKLGI
ncbi:MAG TPA: bifunctional class I SAM-dependent methyltransferase/glycosyltransferase family 2 protein [Polyangiaceae bacterium]|nr:bifunctional class I SAM-dependent methyltransferase/glycosyltransferase family 2 protein [Polyangiaceae bacterium]